MQSSHTITLDWVEIWTAYLEAGLSKREFYRQCLPTLISSRKCPPLGVFYSSLRLLENLAASGQLHNSAGSSSSEVRLLLLPPRRSRQFLTSLTLTNPLLPARFV